MSLLDNNEEVHGYGASVRPLLATVTELKLLRVAAGLPTFAENNIQPSVSGVLYGVAHITNGSIAYIGSDDKRIKKLKFTLVPYMDSIHLKERWESMVQTYNLNAPINLEQETDINRIKQYLQNVYKRYDEYPPSAFIGIFEEWYIECHIPEEIFESLASDFYNGASNSLHVAIDMQPTFINNKYAEYYESVAFGLLDIEKYGQSGCVYITNLTWEKNPINPSKNNTSEN